MGFAGSQSTSPELIVLFKASNGNLFNMEIKELQMQPFHMPSSPFIYTRAVPPTEVYSFIDYP